MNNQARLPKPSQWSKPRYHQPNPTPDLRPKVLTRDQTAAERKKNLDAVNKYRASQKVGDIRSGDHPLSNSIRCARCDHPHDEMLVTIHEGRGQTWETLPVCKNRSENS